MATTRDIQIEPVVLGGWTGGLNRDADEYQLDLTETPNCLNVTFGPRGAVKSREGFSKWSTNEHASMARGEHVFTWEQIGTANDWVVYVDDNGDVFASNDGDFSAAPVISWGDEIYVYRYPVAGVPFNDIFYIATYARGNPYKFDGTTWTEITDTTLDGSGSEFPQCRFLVNKHERLFAFHVLSGGTNYRSRIWFSDAGDADTWQSTSWIDVDPDDGSVITAAVSFSDGIMIFKNRSIFFLSGTDETSFTLYPVEYNIGVSSGKAATTGANKVWFFDPNNGVYTYDGASIASVDRQIRDYLLDGINRNRLYRINTVFYQNKFYLSVPWGTDITPSRTFVYDTDLEAWTEWGFGFEASYLKDGDLYFVAPTQTGGYEGDIGVYKLGGSDDNGTAISSSFETAWLTLGKSPSNLIRLRDADMAFTAQPSTANVTVEMYTDFENASSLSSATVDTNGVNVDQVLARVGGFVSGDEAFFHTMKFKFSSSAAWQLNAISLVLSGRLRLRGDGVL